MVGVEAPGSQQGDKLMEGVGVSLPERCPKCGGPWKPCVHAYMGKIIDDPGSQTCLFCGEVAAHKGIPKKPRRKSGKAGKLRLCLGCRQPLEWDASPLAKYHDRKCKWMAEKRKKNAKNKIGEA